MTTIREALFELNSLVDAKEKKEYVEEHMKDIIDELLALDENDRNHYIEKILDVFEGTKLKGSISKNIDAALSNVYRKEAKQKFNEFTNADLSSMMDNKGNIAYTSAHV